MSNRLLGRRRFLAVFSAATVGVFAAHVAHSALGYGHGGANGLLSDGLYDAVIFAASGICLARGIRVAEDRAAWLLLGAAMCAWATGDLYASVVSPGHDVLETPSPADGFYLAFYPAAYAGLVLLVRRHVRRFPASAWMDGAIEALAVAAVATAIVSRPIINDCCAHGGTGQVATDVVYPLADLVLLSLVVGAFAMMRWRSGRAFGLLGAALAVAAVADGWFLYAESSNTYVDGQPLDSLWLAAALLIAWAAWQPMSVRGLGTPPDGPHHAVTVAADHEIRPYLAVPIASATAALGLLVTDHFTRLVTIALALAAATLVVSLVRMGVTFWEHDRLLTRTRAQALTDALTGLGNRRKLLIDLDNELQAVRRSSPCVLALFDLDGFKDYNDRFGHNLGDALLARLGQRLSAAVGEAGECYRLGGDEFCVILHGTADGAEERPSSPTAVRARLAPAVLGLSTTGGAFAVGCSYGAVALPEEGTTAVALLQLADHRMYAHKADRHDGQLERSHSARESAPPPGREAPIGPYLPSVTELAVAVGRRLRMSAREREDLRRAAAYRDIGKGAIPDDLLAQPEALDADGMAFVRLQSVAGERMLSTVPALRPAAPIVRSTHERFDGTGYPDGLAGDAIPLGSRIIAACHTLGGLVSGRPYRRPITLDEALVELAAGRGTRFDPRVIGGLLEEVLSSLPQSAGPRPIAT
jgi:diguanylate cyclase (GGDEF)-like protein